MRHQHRLRVAEAGLPKTASALSDYAGGMQGVTGGPGITANQLTRFPGAALFAFADTLESMVGGVTGVLARRS